MRSLVLARNAALAALATATLAGCGGSGSESATPSTSDIAVKAAPAGTPAARNAASVAIPDRYIVVFDDGVADPSAAADAAMRGSGGTIHYKYTRALRGFAATIPAAALAGIRNNPNVNYVEQDFTVASTLATPQSQAYPAWGLDRIDQRNLPLNSLYLYSRSGAGVTAFVVDTGIRATHAEFRTSATDATSRVDAAAGYTAIADAYGTGDCAGHGTHVSGTIGGLTYGVAKAVRLVPVRVLDCAGSGTISGVVAGMDFVAKSTTRPAVANLSLGGSASSSLDTAVANTVAAGVTVVVAAGNNGLNACNYSPARAPTAVTVGATDSADARTSWSNFGSCLDLFAPGNAVTSSYYSSDTATATMSGTSMASPHVAGTAALLLEAIPSATPSAIDSALKTAGTSGVLTNIGTGSPNLLAFTNPYDEPLAVGTVSVGSLAGARTVTRNGWTATVTISVRNQAGVAVPGATVSGGFTAGGSAVSCVTGSTGTCSVKTSTLKSTVASTTYSVRGISAAGYAYDATANAISSITVTQK